MSPPVKSARVARGRPAISGVMRAALRVRFFAGFRLFNAGDDRLAGGGEFVDAVGSVDDEGALGAECQKRAADEKNAAGCEHSDDLDAGVRGIGERAAEVEDGAEAERAAQGAEGLHGRVIERRVEEDEAGFAQAFDGEFRRELDGNAEGFEDVGCAAAGGDGAIAVLGDLGAGGCGNQGRAGGDVEGERTAAAGADAVDEFGALFVGERNGHRLLAHDVDEAGEFRGLLAARGEHGEQGGGFDLGHLAGEDLAEHVGGLLARELCAVFGERLEEGLQRIHISQYGNGTAIALFQTRKRPTAAVVCDRIVQQDSIWVPRGRSR